MLGLDQNRRIVQAPLAPGVNAVVSIGAASVQSAVFASDTALIRVATLADCAVAIDTSPTATASSMLMPAGSVEYFCVTPGHRLAVIGIGGATGSLSVSEF